jgi:hypothetical protein
VSVAKLTKSVGIVLTASWLLKIPSTMLAFSSRLWAVALPRRLVSSKSATSGGERRVGCRSQLVDQGFELRERAAAGALAGSDAARALQESALRIGQPIDRGNSRLHRRQQRGVERLARSNCIELSAIPERARVTAATHSQSDPGTGCVLDRALQELDRTDALASLRGGGAQQADVVFELQLERAAECLYAQVRRTRLLSAQRTGRLCLERLGIQDTQRFGCRRCCVHAAEQ